VVTAFLAEPEPDPDEADNIADVARLRDEYGRG